jgi:hypothetical protein
MLSLYRIKIGLIPEMDGTKGYCAHQEVKDAKANIIHKCMNAVLKPIIAAYESGGVYLELFGKTQCFLPVMCAMVQDSKDGNMLTGVLCSCKTNFPCRFCWCKAMHLNNPWILCERRVQAVIATQVQSISKRLKRCVNTV